MIKSRQINGNTAGAYKGGNEPVEKKLSKSQDLNEVCMLKYILGCTEVSTTPMETQIHLYENPLGKSLTMYFF